MGKNSKILQNSVKKKKKKSRTYNFLIHDYLSDNLQIQNCGKFHRILYGKRTCWRLDAIELQRLSPSGPAEFRAPFSAIVSWDVTNARVHVHYNISIFNSLYVVRSIWVMPLSTDSRPPSFSRGGHGRLYRILREIKRIWFM